MRLIRQPPTISFWLSLLIGIISLGCTILSSPVIANAKSEGQCRLSCKSPSNTTNSDFLTDSFWMWMHFLLTLEYLYFCYQLFSFSVRLNVSVLAVFILFLDLSYEMISLDLHSRILNIVTKISVSVDFADWFDVSHQSCTLQVSVFQIDKPWGSCSSICPFCQLLPTSYSS